jgi:hypothetical protein
VRIEGPGPSLRAKSPDVAQQLLLGEDAMGLGRECAQQGELLVRQRDLAVAHPHPTGHRVHGQLADTDRALPTAGPPAQHRGDSRDQLRIVKGLLQVVVGTGLEAAEPVALAAATREDEHRQLGIEAVVRAADLAEDVDARGIRQPKVEHHQIRLVVAAEAQRVRSARGGQGPVAVRRQLVAEQLARRIVVLADHHGGDLFYVRQHERLSGAAATLSPAPGR